MGSALTHSTGGHTTPRLLVSMVGALCYSSICKRHLFSRCKSIFFPASLLCPSAEPGWAASGNSIRASCGTQDGVVMSPWLVPLPACLQLPLPGTMSSGHKCILWHSSAWLGSEEEAEKKSLWLDSSCLYKGVWSHSRC